MHRGEGVRRVRARPRPPGVPDQVGVPQRRSPAGTGRRPAAGRAAPRPGPAAAGPDITAACHSVSEWLSSAPISPSRDSKRRNTVPLPTPAACATASIVTASTPQLVDQALGRLEQRQPVAGGVAALGRGRRRGAGGGGKSDMTPLTLGGGADGFSRLMPQPGIETDRGPFDPGDRPPPPPPGAPMSDTRVLVLVGSLRADSLNRKLAETLQAQAPEGVTVEIAEGLGRAAVLQRGPRRRQRPGGRRRAARPGRRRRPRPGRHARVQRHHAGRPQQRHRLAVAPLRRRRHQGQAVRRRRRHPHAVRRQVGPRRHRPLGRHRRCARRRGRRPSRSPRSRSTCSPTPRSSAACATRSPRWSTYDAEAAAAA